MREVVFTLASYFRFLMISGAIYNGEPQNVSAIASGVKDLPKQSQPLHTKTISTLHKQIQYVKQYLANPKSPIFSNGVTSFDDKSKFWKEKNRTMTTLFIIKPTNQTRTLRRFLLTWGFKSLWIQCFSWSACNPKATNPKDTNNQTKILHNKKKNRSLPNCLIKCLATGSDTFPWRLMYSARSPPLQYSNTRNILSPVYKRSQKIIQSSHLY